jgi:hypothetical protein
VRGQQKGGESLQKSLEFKDKADKKKKEDQQALLAALFKQATNITQIEAKEGEDPKSILCAFFKAGVCKKGQKCKFSHDLEIEKKSTKIDLYTDQRDTMEHWDIQTLNHVVDQKNQRRGPVPSEIVLTDRHSKFIIYVDL